MKQISCLNSQKWVFASIVMLLYFCLNAPMWIKIFRIQQKWAQSLIILAGGAAMLLLTRLFLVYNFNTTTKTVHVSPESTENFKGLHNPGKAFECSNQKIDNLNEKCDSCAYAASECLSNQKCNQESMETCASDDNCTVWSKIQTQKKCGNLQ